jgi:hypothetical protein
MMPPLPNQLLSTRRHALNYWPRNSSWWTSRKACDLKLFRIACVLENHCEYLDRRHRLDRIEIASIGVSRRRPRRGVRRAHVMAFPGKPPIRVERIFTSDGAYLPSNGAWRSIYYSSEPGIEISKAAAIRANGCRMVARNWRATARRRRADHTRSNSKTAEARIWTFDFSGMPLNSKAHLGNGASITHRFRTRRYPTTGRTRNSL